MQKLIKLNQNANPSQFLSEAGPVNLNCMTDLRFVFSNIRSTDLKKRLPNGVRSSVAKGKHEQVNEAAAQAKKKEIPLFYIHKIRAPKYEFF